MEYLQNLKNPCVVQPDRSYLSVLSVALGRLVNLEYVVLYGIYIHVCIYIWWWVTLFLRYIIQGIYVFEVHITN